MEIEAYLKLSDKLLVLAKFWRNVATGYGKIFATETEAKWLNTIIRSLDR